MEALFSTSEAYQVCVVCPAGRASPGGSGRSIQLRRALRLVGLQRI
jgi:hypothetical protein